MSRAALFPWPSFSRSRRVFRHPRGVETGREGGSGGEMGVGGRGGGQTLVFNGGDGRGGGGMESRVRPPPAGCGRWFPVSARSSLAIPWKLLELAGPRLGLGSDWLALGPTDRPFKSPVHLYFTTA